MARRCRSARLAGSGRESSCGRALRVWLRLQDRASARGRRTAFSSTKQVASISLRSILAEGVGFAQILLDLTASFALLNRVIKHYQHLLETQDVTTTRDSFGYSSKVIPMVPTGWQVVGLLDDC